METTSLPPDDRPPEAPPRRVNRGLLWAAALAVVVLSVATVVAFMGGGSDSASKDVERIDPSGTQPVDDSLRGSDVTGEQLPALTYKTFEGADVSLATDGKPLLVNFWSSLCVPCVREMPDLEQSFQTNGTAINYLGLQVAERAQDGLDMIAKTGVTYPTGRDPKAETFRALGGASLPRTVLIRADGTIAWVHTGALSAEQIQQAIDQNLSS